MTATEALAARIRQQLARRRGVAERAMFGGIGFLLHGNLLVCAWKGSLIVRLGPVEGEAALREPHVRPFDVTGRAMKGWAMVAPEGVADDDALGDWMQRALQFVRTLPAK